MTTKKTKKEPSKFDKLNLSEIETRVEFLFVTSRECQMEMYEVLEYMRTSGRFRENPRYKKASFWKYLDDRFTIKETTFRENVRAFTKYPKHAVEYGAGIVAKIDRVCGRTETHNVFSAIEKATTARKTPLPRAKIEEIIQKHSLPKIEKKITDWQAMYEQEKAAHGKTKETLRAAMATIDDLTEQVEKLKKTAGVVTSIRKLFDRQEAPRSHASMVQ